MKDTRYTIRIKIYRQDNPDVFLEIDAENIEESTILSDDYPDKAINSVAKLLKELIG
jgi:hypothetical protein